MSHILVTSIAGENRPSRMLSVAIVDEPVMQHITEVVQELRSRRRLSLSFHTAALDNVGLLIPDDKPVMQLNRWPEISASARRAAGYFLRLLADAGAPFHHEDDTVSGDAELCSSSKVLTVNLFSVEPQSAQA